MLTLYTAADSPFALAVESFLHEADIAHERRVLDLEAGDSRKSAYTTINPFGLVPAIVEEDGFCLSESATILRYVASTHGKDAWYPKEVRARAAVERWMDFLLYGYLNTLRYPIVQALMSPAPYDQETMERAEKRVSWLLNILDDQLSKTTYLAGTTPTIADLLGAALLEFVRFSDVDIARYSHVQSWFNSMSERPRWLAAMKNSVTRQQLYAASR